MINMRSSPLKSFTSLKKDAFKLQRSLPVLLASGYHVMCSAPDGGLAAHRENQVNQVEVLIVGVDINVRRGIVRVQQAARPGYLKGIYIYTVDG